MFALRQCLDYFVRYIGDPGNINIDECRPCVVELAFDDYGRIGAYKVGGDVLLLRKDNEMFGIVIGCFLVYFIEHLGGHRFLFSVGAGFWSGTSG